MPSFTVPFQSEAIDPDPAGPIRRRTRVRLTASVRCGTRWVDGVEFVFDTGASHTLMSATRARALGIVFPPETSRLGMVTAAGFRPGEVHDGELRVRFPQLPGQVFRLLCLFAEGVLPAVPPVFGVHDFLDEFRVALDGAFRPGAAFGRLTVETADTSS